MSTKTIGKVRRAITRNIEKDCTRQNLMAVTIVVPPDDPTPEQRMAIVEASGSLSFWDEPEEDIYSDDDGQPV